MPGAFSRSIVPISEFLYGMEKVSLLLLHSKCKVRHILLSAGTNVWADASGSFE